MSITIFTDGASRGNPGPGGWGAIVISDDQVKELGGSEKDTTNNRMELMGAIKSLSLLPTSVRHTNILLYTDSAYVLNGITKWVHGWKQKKWKTSQKEDVLNVDLWKKLLKAVEGKEISWKLVKGHGSVSGNNRVDEIATAYADGKKIKLYSGPLSEYLVKVDDVTQISTHVPQTKKKDKARSKAEAYSYVSSIDRIVQIHKTWNECMKRVNGVSNARFKKALSEIEEKQIIFDFLKT
ncbi:ribonuclease HI [Candidatus Parcubacteria bacterium]|nr:ribonuclease HI [Candidatus Parcubacteria bacterium]